LTPPARVPPIGRFTRRLERAARIEDIVAATDGGGRRFNDSPPELTLVA
jgi:hypothetical protein